MSKGTAGRASLERCQLPVLLASWPAGSFGQAKGPGPEGALDPNPHFLPEPQLPPAVLSAGSPMAWTRTWVWLSASWPWALLPFFMHEKLPDLVPAQTGSGVKAQLCEAPRTVTGLGLRTYPTHPFRISLQFP